MIIAFDAKRAAQNRTGLGNYSRFVLDILSQHTPVNKFLLYAPNPKKASCLGAYKDNEKFEIRYPKSVFGKMFRSLWRTFGITSCVQKSGAQIFHGLSNELPLNIRKAKSVKSIVTVHDLIFLHCPQYYSAIDRFLYNYKYRRSCLNADHIIAVSEYTKREIMQLYGIPSEKITVVYQGCDKVFAQREPESKLREVRKTYSLPHQYILYVGSIEERKNLMLLAKALKLMPDHIRVVAVGKRTSYAAEVEKYLRSEGLEERMQMIHGVPFDHLPAIYQMATVFCYPSRIEGFGIPLLEALNSGVPVVACTGSCLEEAGGPDSVYVAPDDDRALAKNLIRIWDDRSLQQQMVEAGYRYAHNFADEKLAANLMQVYEKVLNS